MQDHKASDSGHRVPPTGMRGAAGSAPDQAGTRLLRLLGLPRLHVRDLGAAGERGVPEVRGDIRHGTIGAGPCPSPVRARRMRLRAGGRRTGCMKDVLTRFLRYLSVERNASRHTVRAYRTDLEHLCQFSAAPGCTKVDAVATRLIRAYLAHLHPQGRVPASVGRHLSALRSWFRFLVRRGEVERNVARDVRSPRLSRKLATFLPID